MIIIMVIITITIYIALRPRYILNSALHYIEDYKLVLNTFLKRNVLRCFLKEARLLQDLMGHGNKFHKT